MHPSLRAAVRRAAWAMAACAALLASFVVGVAAGAGSAPARSAGPDVLDDAAAHIAGDALHPVERDVLEAAAIRAMLDAANDQWGSWGDASSSSGSYAGVGLWIQGAGSTLSVSQVAKHGAAQAAEVEVGDLVRAIDGQSAADLTAVQAADALRGEVGTTVRVVFERASRLRSVTLTRAVVAAPAVRVEMAAPGVGRIVVPAFERGTARAVRAGLKTLLKQHATGVVLDLRGDPGGLLNEAVETAGVFLDGGIVVTYTRRDETPQSLHAAPGGDTSTPLVVLVDGGTASAAEIVAGALQDHGRAVVIGGRTFGKGTVQEPRLLSDGSSLALTVARYTLPSGRSVEGVGIEPDIQVAGYRAPLSRSVEVLSGLRADAGGGGRG